MKFSSTEQLFSVVKDQFLIDEQKNNYRTPHFTANNRTAKIRTAEDAIKEGILLYSPTLKANISVK